MTMTLKLSWEDLRATWVSSGAILGQPGVILGLFWENLLISWAEGSVLEMLNRFRSAPVQ